NREIAAQLHITEDTVKAHMKNIFSKLDAKDRTHAVMVALKRGILQVKHCNERPAMSHDAALSMPSAAVLPTHRLRGDIICFGPFRLAPAARTLERNGVPLELGSRALDILIVLVEHAGEIINHKELMAKVWRGLVV